MQLSEVVNFQNGFAFKSKDFKKNGNYKVIKIKEIKDGSVKFFSDTATVDLEDLKSYDKYIIKKGDILFALTGDPVSKKNPLSWVGRVAIYNHDELALLNQRVCKLIPNEKINPKYIYYYFREFDNFYKLASIAKGSASQANISTKDIGNTEINIPSIEIQNKIVEFLDSISNKISLNEKINNNLEQQVVLLFKEWFTDFVNTSSNLIETQFGLIPDTFRLLKNGELPMVVTDYVANGSFASLKANVTLYQEPNYAYFIRNTDLKSGSFKVFVDENSYRFLSKSTLYGGEIIISNVGDVGSVFLCPKLNKPMTLGNNVIMLRPEQDNLKYYLYVWFKWLYGQSLIQGIKGGSAQPKFNKTDFKNLPIFLPTDDLLEQFQQMVKPIFELIEKNNEENQALIVTRDTLLPKLISGEFDISDIEL